MTFSLWDTFLPLAAFMALAAVLPVRLVPRGCLSQGRLARGMGLTAAVVFAASAAWFAEFHWRAGDAFRLGAVLVPAAMSALAWGPVWAFVWLLRAQGVEARKGEAAMRDGVDLGPGG